MSVSKTRLALLLATLPAMLPAQQARTPRILTADGAPFPGQFSLPRSVRELPDGRLLVVDWLEQKLLVLDWARGTSAQVGRSGSGPAEYRLPSRLIPLGDTTLLRDLGNDRLLLIGPDLTFLGSFRGPDDAGYPVSPTAADRAGWLYFEIPGWAVNAAPGDSIVVARWNRKGGRIEPVARVRSYTPRQSSGQRMGIPMVMFAPEDGWAVAPDGRVVLIRSGDYSVEIRGPDKRVVRGRSQAYPTRAVRAADREWMVRRFLATSPMSGRGPGGGMGLTPAELQTDAEVARLTGGSAFAESLPYFSPGGVWISPAGDTWVQRTTGADETIVLDRFDQAGLLREQVQLPKGRTPLAVGRAHVFVTTTDADGLQQLERYRY